MTLTKEQLLDLKKRITQGEKIELPVGYPSIDCPQKKYFRKSVDRDLSPYKTIYDMVFCDNDMNADALGYLDGMCNWSYQKLKNTTDKCIAGLVKKGVQEGDTVLLGVSNSPELVATVIALVTLGASVKFFDIRANKNDIVKYANSGNCRYMIALDRIVLPKVVDIIDQTNLEKVFVLRPFDSLSSFEKLHFLYENRKDLLNIIQEHRIILPKNGNYYQLAKVIRSGRIKNFQRAEYDESRPSLQVQSSGTTGKAKTIVHSEKSAVEFAKSFSHTDLPMEKGKRVLVALPPWIAYGIGVAILTPLSLGCKVVLCKDFESDAVFRNIGKFDMAYAAPFHYRYIRNHYHELSDEKKKALSKVDCLVTGGDKYSAQENAEDEKLFGTLVVNGYGNNENWGALSVNPLADNHYGSVGIPKYGETTIIYDNKNGVELPYGEIGEVCTLSKTHFLGYAGNEEATKKTLKLHDDGNYWLHMGDYGYIDQDGFIYLNGRKERVIIRLGFKLSAYTIEDAISSLPYVSECITVEVPDALEEHVPMSFVVLQNDVDMDPEQVSSLIKSDISHKLKENEIPKYIKIVPSLKYTNNNKYDFKYYEKIGQEFVDNMDEFSSSYTNTKKRIH